MAIDYGITGKRALVCAASQGLGLASAQALAAAGVELFLCARSESTLKTVSHELTAQGTTVHVRACDLSNLQDRQDLLDELAFLWPEGPDIVVHNGGGPAPSTVLTTPFEAWQAGFDLMFKPAVHLNQTLIPLMQARGWGRVVHITSGAVAEPVATLPVSNAIRSAVTAYNKTLAREIAASGVTVNCVAPGFIATDRLGHLFEHQATAQGKTADQIRDGLTQNIPAGRLGQPEELGALVAFLCSQGAGYLTGETILVDGGKRQALI